MIKLAMKLIHTISEFECGICANYFPINGEFGFKFFYSLYYAERTHEFQTKAHAVGAAPKIGSDIHKFRHDDMNAYGYVTQSVRLLGYDYLEREYPGYDNFKIAKWKELYQSVPGYWGLHSRLRDIGLGNDLHGANYGWLALTDDGNPVQSSLVAIDFSEH